MNRFPGIRRVLRLGARTVELEEELAFHFERTVEELVGKGLSPRQAEEEARRRFGDEGRWRRELQRIDRGAAIRQHWAEGLAAALDTLMYAFRRLRRSPGLTLGVVLTFALGIGANATMFAIVDRLLLSPPAHVQDPDGVQRLLTGRAGEPATMPVFSYPSFRDISEAKSFSSVAAFAARQVTVGRGAEARQQPATLATASFFPLLGVRPTLGRFYSEEEDRVGAPGVVVIGHELWQGRFGGAADVLERTVDFGYGPYSIIGVAPPGFTGVNLHRVDYWLPLHTSQGAMSGTWWENGRHGFWLGVIGRLASGASPTSAAEEATALLRRGDSEAGIDSDDVSVVTAPLIAARGPDAPPEAAVARWLVGLSALVLLIACANVANLLLARTIRQRREVGIRLALGSSRGRIVAQVLVESVLLAAMGGLAASLLARLAGGVVGGVLLPDIAWQSTGLGVRVAVLVLVLAVLAGFAAGLIPAFQASRPRLTQTLKIGGRSVTDGGGRARGGLTILQTALSIVLLVGAGLFVRSLHHVRSLDLGFDADGVLIFNPVFERGLTDAHTRAIMARARERLLQVPGVEHASGDVTIPFQSLRGTGLEIPGVDSIPGGTAIHVVDPGYFSAVGLQILRGRPIGEEDTRASDRVAVVNETMARRIWPGEDALGQCLQVGGDGGAPNPPCSTVVGVAEDAHSFELIEDPSMHYFIPAAQEVVDMTPEALLIRVHGPAAERVEDVRRALLTVDPALRYANVQPLQDLIDPSARSWRLGATMFSAFGLLALLVAGIGLYSVLAFSVAERTQELGIRSALGAGRERLIRMVVARGLWLVGAGVVLGLLVAIVAASTIEPLLFQLRARDPLTLAVAAATLILVGLVASWIPALRATRIDPSRALRTD